MESSYTKAAVAVAQGERSTRFFVTIALGVALSVFGLARTALAADGSP